jgi:endogenous inhibitor of DNA gyrase (YacG/DUF329 family)
MPRFEYNDELDTERRDVVKLRQSNTCWNCGSRTLYADIDFGAYLCSTECQDVKIAEWFEADRRATEKYGAPCG